MSEQQLETAETKENAEEPAAAEAAPPPAAAADESAPEPATESGGGGGESAPAAEAPAEPPAEPPAEAPSEPGRSSLKKGTGRRSSARASVVIAEEAIVVGEEKAATEQPHVDEAAKAKAEADHMAKAQASEEDVGEMYISDAEPEDKRILLVGTCVMDYVLICDKYPTEDSDRRALDGYWQRGGNASNNATVLRQLNAPVEFFGMLSNSDAFSCLIEDCHNRGILIEHCPRIPTHPPFSSVMLSEATGTRTIVHCNQNFPYVTYQQFRGLGDLRQYMWAHFESRNVNETLSMMKLLWSHNEKHDNKVQISLDLEVVSKETFKLAPYADLNILGKDLARYMGWNDPIKACKGLRTLIQSIEDELGHKSLIVVPWSEQGAACMDLENNVVLVPAYPPPVIHDTLGAGDTFSAALIHALCIQEMQIRDAVDYANRIAGYKCGHRGYDAISKMPKETLSKVEKEDDY